jgi:hypothetical protein
MTELISNLIEITFMVFLSFVVMFCSIEYFKLNKKENFELEGTLPEESEEDYVFTKPKRDFKFIPCKDFYLEETYLIEDICRYQSYLGDAYFRATSKTEVD